MYTRLTERLGLSDHLLVLNVMLSKIATNLKVYGACDDVVTATLALFQVQHSLPWDVMPVITSISLLASLSATSHRTAPSVAGSPSCFLRHLDGRNTSTVRCACRTAWTFENVVLSKP